MGYASYFEEIRDRIAENEESLKKVSKDFTEFEISAERHTQSVNLTRQLDALKSIYRDCESMLSQIKGLLEIATDPALDVAAELIVLRLDVKNLRVKNQELEQERKIRIEAEQRVRNLEDELRKRKMKKHYIKGNPAPHKKS